MSLNYDTIQRVLERITIHQNSKKTIRFVTRFFFCCRVKIRKDAEERGQRKLF